MIRDGWELDCPACGQPLLLPALLAEADDKKCVVCEHVLTDRDLARATLPVNRFGMDHDI